MSFTTLLTWTSKKAYLAYYANDESAMNAASKFWNSISSWSWVLLLAMLVVAIIVCWIYFFPFNNRSGKHYKPIYRYYSWLISFVAAFVVTMVLSYFMAKNPSFGFGLICKISFINAIYAIVISLIVSLILDQTGRSNAYPLFLFKKAKHK